jgi:hypothetical protein
LPLVKIFTYFLKMLKISGQPQANGYEFKMTHLMFGRLSTQNWTGLKLMSGLCNGWDGTSIYTAAEMGTPHLMMENHRRTSLSGKSRANSFRNETSLQSNMPAMQCRDL